jgi:hypothetical protein
VSSILEALRELEGDRPPAVRRELPPPEAPRGVARRATGAVIPILGGLAVGVVAFGIYAWGPRITTPPAVEPAAVAPAPETPAADAQPAERPNWLDTADAPRAKVGRTATAPPTPAVPSERSATAERPADPPPARPAAEERADSDSGSSSGGGQVAVEKISYSDDAAARVATMRFKGRRVTLRQRESIDGIEVQLIMPNGVYVQRGSETYLLPLSR